MSKKLKNRSSSPRRSLAFWKVHCGILTELPRSMGWHTGYAKYINNWIQICKIAKRCSPTYANHRWSLFRCSHLRIFPRRPWPSPGRQQALRSRHGRGASGHLASAGSTGILCSARSSSPSDSYELPASGWPCPVAKKWIQFGSEKQTCTPLRPPRTALASWSKERSDETMAKRCCWGEILLTLSTSFH